MNYLSDKEMHDVLVKFLAGDKEVGGCYYTCMAPCECCHYGLELLSDGSITCTPGWITLWYPSQKFMNLGLAWDMPDDVLNRLRRSIASALETLEIPFIPISWFAFRRLGITVNDKVTLVERIGMECVFACKDRYYISGFDRNESPPLYFLARLPHAVETYAEAIEALKPESVKLAESQGAKILRQGDMFAIPSDYADADLVEMGAKFIDLETEREELDLNSHSPRQLYGTNHYATKVARLPDGITFGRGQLTHSPFDRPADHAPLSLVPDGWYLIVKNTVPTTQAEEVNP